MISLRVATQGVLFVSVLVLAACGGGDKPHQSSPPAQAPPAKSEALGESSRQLLAWLPDPGAVPGWTRTGEPRRYGPGNLWEYIDGAAETFLTFGFQEAATADYADAARKLEVTIDIYRMGDPTGAYGMYAEERNPSATFLPVGSEGYRSGNVLNFWAGPCYVKLTAPREDPGLTAGLEALAAEVARRIGGAGPRPAVFDRFPAAGLVAHSFRVLPKDVLAQSYLSNGFEGEYRDGGKPWKLLLVVFDADDAASGALDRYQAFLASSGPAPRRITAPGQGGFVGKDGYYGLVVAARAGRHLAIAVGAPSERQATAQLSALLKQ
ncbi:MAG: hypothetical protein EHM24_04810 [Acidobacteria bacterium]|nr:MAG: hypothetical protein EHM24_12970 [Acidobacteriota bacterium]RPJ75144.1 MAG: hypothetical protein EHM24_04810 [Acidobacteriota bacterium]